MSLRMPPVLPLQLRPLTNLQWVLARLQGPRMGRHSRHMRRCLGPLVRASRRTGWQLLKLPMLVKVGRHKAMVRHSSRLNHLCTSIRDPRNCSTRS